MPPASFASSGALATYGPSPPRLHPSMGGHSMNDIDAPNSDSTLEEPTLSELLTEEMRSGRDLSEELSGRVDTSMSSDSGQHAGEIPMTLAAELTAASFSEPVLDEVDWLIADRALLNVKTRERLLAGVDRALRLRRADDEIQKPSEDLFRDVPDELVNAAEELRRILIAVENGNMTVNRFRPVHVNELVRTATIDPMVAYAAFRRGIRCAQAIRPDNVPVMARHISDDWENHLTHLRHLLVNEQGPNLVDDASEEGATDGARS